ncbi:GH25 family lysozyme [Solirubrobacter soli]|uniref:GH25 family lysozyme n=1 Tax=Solirubrobacter soli TaxID=363832 RepID=UPI00041862A5|nr:GH25 family lysozyme [Solirubrobacter soli]
MLAGPDVSEYQGEIAWPRVRLQGGHELAFAIAKASEGSGWTDPQFAANWHGIRERGLIRGAYHFANLTVPDPATTAAVRAAATAEAQHFVEVLHSVGGTHAGDLPPALDFERSRFTSTLSSAQLYEWAATWVATVDRATGRRPMIYAGGFWRSLLDGYTDVWDCPLWLADYAAQPQLLRSWSRWTFWQFTDAGTFEGIAGAVDTSYFRGSHADLEALVGGAPEPAPAPPHHDPGVPAWRGRVLKEGVRGSDVLAWQQQMHHVRGFVRLPTDGVFDARCAEGCRWLQLYLGLPPTEAVDHAVWHATWSAP